MVQARPWCEGTRCVERLLFITSRLAVTLFSEEVFKAGPSGKELVLGPQLDVCWSVGCRDKVEAFLKGKVFCIGEWCVAQVHDGSIVP